MQFLFLKKHQLKEGQKKKNIIPSYIFFFNFLFLKKKIYKVKVEQKCWVFIISFFKMEKEIFTMEFFIRKKKFIFTLWSFILSCCFFIEICLIFNFQLNVFSSFTSYHL
jgi:hypothetical protein